MTHRLTAPSGRGLRIVLPGRRLERRENVRLLRPTGLPPPTVVQDDPVRVQLHPAGSGPLPFPLICPIRQCAATDMQPQGAQLPGEDDKETDAGDPWSLPRVSCATTI
eukprot:TRINITY_DN23875_c0_g1_i1.p3 TRINITY_DN23875_c0_g1~~TRINITY_DN23875_c0_g1_i1.p3  ORF type:complete len:108 (+),score=5.75 TRINITY_DN23875_c0_g1_i1:324-647(+)